MEIKTEKFTGGGGREGNELLKFKGCYILYLYPLCPEERLEFIIGLWIKKGKNALRAPYCLQHRFQLGSLRAESTIKTWVKTDYEIVQKAGMSEQEERDQENQPMCGYKRCPAAEGLSSAKTPETFAKSSELST